MKGFYGILRDTSQEARPETPASPAEAGESPAVARRKGRRRAVVDLVLASFVVALTPMVLGLAWNLISGIGDRIDRAIARASESAEPWGHCTP
jgi:hypothetical protein